MRIRVVSWPSRKSLDDIMDDILAMGVDSIEGEIESKNKKSFFLSPSKKKPILFEVSSLDDDNIQKLATKGIVVERIEQ